MGDKHIGGQAVIEGVMMLSREKAGVAVRKPNGKIGTRKFDFHSWTKKKFWGWPFVRGMVVLVETFYLGMKAMSWSAREASGEEEEELSRMEIIGTIIFSILMALFLFKLIPLLFASLIPSSGSNIIFNLMEGLAKILILVGYIWAISLMEDVRRIFQYHGAEHKTISCYQKDKRLTIKNIQKEPKEHTSCGTSFIFLVVFLSILFYMAIPLHFSFWIKYGIRILLLPVIAGVSYEIIKLANKKKENVLFKIITYPGIALQYITTREPDDEMVKVARKALYSVK